MPRFFEIVTPAAADHGGDSNRNSNTKKTVTNTKPSNTNSNRG